MSFFSVFFFWLPLLSIIGLYLVSGFEDWFFMLIAAVIMVMAHGAKLDRVSNRNVAESEEIDAKLDAIRFERIRLLNSIGTANKNGQFNARQRHIISEIDTLNQQEQELRNQTEVINLEPLGHNVGKVYKNRK